MKPSAPPHWRVDLSLVLVALIWGATFVLVKAALAHISTILFLTLRFALAAAALLLIFGRRIQRGRLPQTLRIGILAGVCLFAGYTLQTFGLKFTTPGKAGFLTGLYIPLVPLIAFALYRKLPRTTEIAGILLAFSGMALISFEPGAWRIGLGDFLIVLCAVAYAFHILVLGHFAKHADVPGLTVVQIAMGALIGAGCFWWVEPVQADFPAIVWIALLVTSLLATAFAFALQTWAQSHTSPTRTA
ncbi:MAG TPA: DMT family transporter, partial [Bryobacteraceae bacterium]|nr:DMT family transporter [Bryobacteraceae bacterium]